MKKLTKKILTLALSVTLALGSSLNVSAVTSESLNNKQSEYGEGRIAVSGNVSEGQLRIQQSDVADGFKMYKIADVTWDEANQTYNAAAWNFEPWFASAAGTSYNNTTYKTPAQLANASSTVQKSFFEALLSGDGNVISDSANYGASSTAVADWNYDTAGRNGSSSVGTVAFHATESVTVTESNYLTLGMEKIQKYVYNNITYYSVDDLKAAGGNETDATATDCYKETTTTVNVDGTRTQVIKYYDPDEVYSTTPAYWEVSNLPFGIYAIMASNASIKYAPVVIAVAPQQEAPSGKWYLDTKTTTNLKAGQVVLEKKINGAHADTVAVGDTVEFEVITSFPSYPNRVTVSTKLSGAAADKPQEYKLNFDDEMSTAFNVDQSSFKISYRESTEDEWKEMEDYQNLTFYALGDETMANGNTLITEDNASNFGYTADEEGKYAIQKTGDVFVPIIGSKATEPASAADAAKMGKGSTSDATWGNRGGLGISAFGCTNHQSEFQLYILRNPSKPRLLFYYYLKDGQFTFMRVDDIDTGRGSTNFSDAADGTISDSEGTLLTYSVNLSDNSQYMYVLRDEYNRVTGSTNYHGMQYFPSWGKNVFNISFDVNALKKWIQNKNIKNIQQIRVTYSATVTGDAKVNSEDNTNTATLTYETTADGKQTSTMSDTVRAYTYGINVVKVDGATTENTTPTYLSGAEFALYKEADTFISETDTSDTSYVYKGSMSSVMRGVGEAVPEVDTTTLEQYKTNHAGDGYYYYSYDATEDGTLDNGVTYSQGNHIVRVFRPVVINDKVLSNNGRAGAADTTFNGTLTSNASASGVTLKGLNTGNYVLSETKAPAGYNELAEDILFSLYRLNENIANTTYAGSYKFFADDAYDVESSSQTVTDDDGMYKLNVLNYQGLTLPSTGGMGTLLFTILGILLMIAAIIFVICRNRKKRNTITTFCLLGLLSITMVLAVPEQAHAITTIQLNDEFGNRVTGANNTVSFKVQLKNAGDTIEVYPIAELTWDDANDTYTGPAWTTSVKQYLGNLSDYQVYDTPEKLGEADASVQTALLKQLYDGRNINNLTTNRISDTKVVLSQDGLSYQVEGVPYGIYMIKARNTVTGKEYAELTVNAMPTQEGPMGYWYLKSDITASLKFSSINSAKTINGKKSDTVAIGEKVDFVITGEVPMYPNLDANGEELVDQDGNPDYSNFHYAMIDQMSDAFAYDENKGLTVEYGVMDPGTGEMYYTKLDEDKYTTLFGDELAGNVGSAGLRYFKDNSSENYVYARATQIPNNTGFLKVDWYVFSPKTGALTFVYSGNVNKNSSDTPGSVSDFVSAYKTLTGVQSPSFVKQTITDKFYNVTFDYAALRELKAESVRISYQAEVTQDIAVGEDTNTNRASFYYQQDIAGNTTTSDSEIKAWTYAVNIVKTDGTTNAYLEGAKFKLYKEAYTYVPNREGLDTADTNYANYVWSSSIDGSDAAPKGTVNGTADTEMTNLSLLNQEDTGDYYFRYVEVTGACPETVANCEATGNHTHIIAYKVYTYKNATGDDTTEITSVATAQGVTVKGLEPASYVLIETSAPLGYNEMLEALRFEINEIGLDDPNYLDSKKGFYSEEEVTDGATRQDVVQVGDKYYQKYDDGVYPINVKNYKGLVLPSTGGMGTMIFTIAGILLMFAAIVTVVLKKRNQKYQ